MGDPRAARHHENWNRYFDSSNGAYLGPEPLLESTQTDHADDLGARALDAYAFARNGPHTLSDPDGPNVRNGTSTTVYVRVESKDEAYLVIKADGTEVSGKSTSSDDIVALAPGESFIGGQDAVAAPELVPDLVYKTVSGVNVALVTDRNGELTVGFSINELSLKQFIAQSANCDSCGGWKGEAWHQRHVLSAGDRSWKKIFDASRIGHTVPSPLQR